MIESKKIADITTAAKGGQPAAKPQMTGPAQKVTAPSLSGIDFALGKLFKARVVLIEADGRVVLDLEGREMTAKSLTPLKVGDEFWLEVKKADQVPLLATAGRKGAIAELLRFFLFDSPQPAKALEALAGGSGKLPAQGSSEAQALLNRIFQGITENSLGREADPGKLVKIISWFHGGVQSEKRSVFPASLMKQLNTLVSLMEKQGEGLIIQEKAGLASLKKMAEMLEAMRSVNTYPVEKSDVPFFLFPCFFSGANGWGEWMFSFGRDGPEADPESSGYHLDFFLNMSRLGDVHAHVKIKESALNGSIVLSSKPALAHLESFLPELTEKVENLGYSPVNFSCSVSRSGTLQQLHKTLQEKAGLKSFAILDVTA
ncbi:MAG: flagellar hook-length control protein FliK [Desulfobulbaceae bacterium]|nr:flagellar hook-length control protein FliK [Desulfobulbaceae bacterium]